LATSRIELLEQILAQDPKNLLARYGLAMAYVNQNDFGRAIPEFEAVLENNPEYSAAYYHGGQTLEKLGRLDDARLWYRQGIAVSRDPHARGELEAALAILGDE
jgi:tetratricopeptide (TPR) repeat protein